MTVTFKWFVKTLCKNWKYFITLISFWLGNTTISLHNNWTRCSHKNFRNSEARTNSDPDTNTDQQVLQEVIPLLINSSYLASFTVQTQSPGKWLLEKITMCESPHRILITLRLTQVTPIISSWWKSINSHSCGLLQHLTPQDKKNSPRKTNTPNGYPRFNKTLHTPFFANRTRIRLV